MSFTMKQWELCESYAFSGFDLYNNPKIINNLQGDRYDYRIIMYLEESGVNSGLRVRFGGSSLDGGNNYSYGRITGGGAAPNGSFLAATNEPGINVWAGTNGNYSSLGIFDVIGKSSMGYNSGLVNTTTYAEIRSGRWNNTTDEIKKIGIYGTAYAGYTYTGNVWIFRRPKQQVFNAADWELVEEKSVSSQDMSSNPVYFTNLRGDTDEIYILETELTGSTSVTSFTVEPNGDSTVGNYRCQYVSNSNGSIPSGTGNARIWLNNTDDAKTAIGRILIDARSGVQRSILDAGSGTVPSQQLLTGFWWANTADEINKIKIVATNTNPQTGKLRLYRRSKKLSTPAHLQLIERHDISGDFSGGYTFKNLHGDSDGLYYIRLLRLQSSADFNIVLGLNGDTGANYTRVYMRGSGSSSTGGYSAGSTFYGGFVSSDYPGISEIWTYPKSGKYRPIIVNSAYENSNAYYIENNAYWWNNSSDEIRKITAIASASTPMSGQIELYKIPLK